MLDADMESRWYIPPGHTEQDTKISDRGHALHIKEKAFKRITKHLDRKRLIQEALDKDAAHKKALKEGSEAMTRQWDDSVENIRKRQQEERNKRLGIKEVDKLQKFYELKKEQEAQRDELERKIKLEMFRDKGYCRTMTSALYESDALYERERQIEFQKELNKPSMREAKIMAIMMEKAEEEEKREAEKVAKKKEVNMAYGEELKETIKEKAEKRKEEKEQRRKKEAMDNILAMKEMDEIEQQRQKEAIEKRRKLRIECKTLLARERARREVVEREIKEMEQGLDLFNQAKDRMKCISKQKDKEIFASFMESRLAVGKQFQKEMEEKNKEMEEAEKKLDGFIEATEEEKAQRLHMEQVERRERDTKSRNEQYQAFLEATRQQKMMDDTMQEWEMINRYKKDELQKQMEAQDREKKRRKIEKYRQELIKQMKESDEKQKKDQDEEAEDIYKPQHEEEDKKFFDYANEVLNRAESKGRPLFPIQKVILQYKKDNDLLPKNGIPRMCEHYIRECSKKKTKPGLDAQDMAMLQAGFLKCKCCKNYFKDT